MSVVVVATIRPQCGCRDQVVAALENAVTASMPKTVDVSCTPSMRMTTCWS